MIKYKYKAIINFKRNILNKISKNIINIKILKLTHKNKSIHYIMIIHHSLNKN